MTFKFFQNPNVDEVGGELFYFFLREWNLGFMLEKEEDGGEEEEGEKRVTALLWQISEAWKEAHGQMPVTCVPTVSKQRQAVLIIPGIATMVSDIQWGPVCISPWLVTISLLVSTSTRWQQVERRRCQNGLTLVFDGRGCQD